MIMLRICSTFLLFFIFIFLSCTSIDNPTISEKDFITIYANLTIINELNVNKDFHDQLVQELLHEFNIQVADIQKSVEFYQKNPRQWLDILEKVKNKISEMRKTERAIPRS